MREAKWTKTIKERVSGENPKLLKQEENIVLGYHVTAIDIHTSFYKGGNKYAEIKHSSS